MAQVLAQNTASRSDAGRTINGWWGVGAVGLRSVTAPARPSPKQRTALPFRAVNLQGTPGYDGGLQRHHLLPLQLRSKRCFDALFHEIGGQWPGFDDFRRNGMLLPASDAAALRTGLPLHRGPHRDYNAMVIERVGQVEADWSNLRRRAPQAAHDDAVASLQSLQRALHRRLLDPGLNRLTLNRFAPLGHGADFSEIDAMVDLLWPASDPEVQANISPAFISASVACLVRLAMVS